MGYIFYTEGSKLGLSCWLTQNRRKVVMYGTQNQRQEINEGLYRAAKLRLLNFLSLFRDLQKPTRFSGGGGSSRIFP